MTKKVTVIDYGMGNILSVEQALDYCGAQTDFARRKGDLKDSGKIVIPGVGAFADGMRNLKNQELIEDLRERLAAGASILGICLGMQMLFESTEEFGFHTGLSFIKGKVCAIPLKNEFGKTHKIPHIGWNKLFSEHESSLNGISLFRGIPEYSSFYFLHSYAAHPEPEEMETAYCHYNQIKICAAIQKEILFGCQFHPEKSGANGLKLLKNFVELKT